MENEEKLNKKLIAYLNFIRLQPRGFVYRNDDTEATLTSSKNIPSFKHYQLQQLYANNASCTACPLSNQGRTQVVFGDGNHNARLLFIGEGPGHDEDLQGKPFIGRAGKLLTNIIAAMGLDRRGVFITNVVKCRPPQNRTPLPSESKTCSNILLFEEIKIIQPEIICTLGSSATKALLGDHIAIGTVRGIMQTYKEIPVMPTYHPAYLLRNPAAKHEVWLDMQKIMSLLDLHLRTTTDRRQKQESKEGQGSL